MNLIHFFVSFNLERNFMNKMANTNNKKIISYGSDHSLYKRDFDSILQSKNLEFASIGSDSNSTFKDLYKLFGEDPPEGLADMLYPEKLKYIQKLDYSPSSVVFFCTKFSIFSPVDGLTSKNFVDHQFENVGMMLDILNCYLEKLRWSGGKIIFVGINTKKYGSPLMANSDSTQSALISVIASLRKNLDNCLALHKPIRIIHVETTRPDIDFFNLFEESFDASERKRENGMLYGKEIGHLWDLVESEYSKAKIQINSAKLSTMLIEIIEDSNPNEHYLID